MIFIHLFYTLPVVIVILDFLSAMYVPGRQRPIMHTTSVEALLVILLMFMPVLNILCAYLAIREWKDSFAEYRARKRVVAQMEKDFGRQQVSS